VEDFEISKHAQRSYFVSVDRELIERVQQIARRRGLSTESLVNLLLEQRLHEIEKPDTKG
ncbi:MAG: ribbon-helix-helix protein, CopG family, partial [Calditrichia bacterium]